MPVFTIHNINELKPFVKKLLPEIFMNRIVAFYGKMGVGKTTLIKAICKQMNVMNVVTSPTFALVNEYKTKNGDTIYHFDFYRINKVEEIYDFGYEEYFFSENYCFIEWPEPAESILPQNVLKINISEDQIGNRIIALPDYISI